MAGLGFTLCPTKPSLGSTGISCPSAQLVLAVSAALLRPRKSGMPYVPVFELRMVVLVYNNTRDGCCFVRYMERKLTVTIFAAETHER